MFSIVGSNPTSRTYDSKAHVEVAIGSYPIGCEFEPRWSHNNSFSLLIQAKTFSLTSLAVNLNGD